MMRIDRLLFALTIILFVGALGRDRIDLWVMRTDMPVLVYESSVEIRDRNGDMLRAYTVADGRWRLAVRLGQVDPQFIKMLIAYEDKRFFRHNGVDWRALLRAAGQAIWHREIVSGGSTLTMQVARLTEESGTGTWEGKLRQIRVALALERRLSKQEILNIYLSRAPYGGNLEGVRAASLAWFGKEPRRLTPAQSALLVALPQSPEARRPDRDRRTATLARDRVLARLLPLLGEETVKAALLDPVPAYRLSFPRLAPHLADRLRQKSPGQLRHDVTVDATLQLALERLAAQAMEGRDKRLSVAILVGDHQTGEILASVGSAAYAQTGGGQGFVDMTQAVRSPGSTLKPLVYAMAFDKGLAHPETLINDRPVTFGGYAPRNFDGAFRGEIRIADALKQSLNIPVVLLTQEIGPLNFLAALRQAGTDPQLPSGPPGLAVSLGGIGMTLSDLVTLYATLAQGGRARPLSVLEKTEPGASVISQVSAWHVGHILSDLPPPAGAPPSRLSYKTGTSYGHRDTWAIGYDGTHVAGVWIGRPDGTPVPGAFGGDYAAPLLFEVFQRIKPQFDPQPPPPAETILLSTEQLPQPLRRFRGRNASFEASRDTPKLAFPPEGALVMLDDGVLTLKFRDGAPPFAVLANGKLVRTGVRRREISLTGTEPGFSEFSVIDAKGRSDRVRVELR